MATSMLIVGQSDVHTLAVLRVEDDLLCTNIGEIPAHLDGVRGKPSTLGLSPMETFSTFCRAVAASSSGPRRVSSVRVSFFYFFVSNGIGRLGPNLEPGTMRVYATNGPRNGLNIGGKVGPRP